MRLKELIEQTNTRQRDLCSVTGVAHSTMSQYVNGQREPGINTLKKLADYFGVTVDYLINHDTQNNKEPPAPWSITNGTLNPRRLQMFKRSAILSTNILIRGRTC